MTSPSETTKRECNHCLAMNDVGNRFCFNCGSVLMQRGHITTPTGAFALFRDGMLEVKTKLAGMPRTATRQAQIHEANELETAFTNWRTHPPGESERANVMLRARNLCIAVLGVEP